ncbi:secreted RxLR effector protein 78-like [Telopea speciosissima]|uniref:secreted RxLR effector protein 78-like n=1 Tax=Telopea speciosissima TaxID=54955 RepID=UPI001CC53B91|nr:secreted RxLR effector protein 78-like [Telopea speciosissima]
MGKVVSDNQSAFIKGRSIVDNILVCHDIVRGIEQKGTSPTAVLKIDLHKAYDSLSRKFLFEIMERMGFPSMFIRWVKACVDTPCFSILLNGSPTVTLGEEGNSAGGPLSPYLFTIAMEGFSALMRKLEMEGQISLPA